MGSIRFPLGCEVICRRLTINYSGQTSDSRRSSLSMYDVMTPLAKSSIPWCGPLSSCAPPIWESSWELSSSRVSSPYLFGRHGTMILAIVALPIFMRMKLKDQKFEYNVDTRRSLSSILSHGHHAGLSLPLSTTSITSSHFPLLPLSLAFSYQILSSAIDRRLSLSIGCFGMCSLFFMAAFFSFNSLSLLNVYSPSHFSSLLNFASHVRIGRDKNSRANSSWLRDVPDNGSVHRSDDG
ncbi:hypothetical protein PMAYCL1PPCAC_06963 [Pristionchus mayeri]|uniref:Uncharacterized protein n=1 Tax=Pristionchus mayeri TaxID=1317129 RepID=A0AAN5C4C1_9BILA|nr:hypothetical protein PMAYCL1PPCAC_06963 [Pristionchus mayeri]